MQSESDHSTHQPEPPRKSVAIQAPDYSRTLRPIAEVLTQPDFPKSALGEFVDVGGYTGVVTEIVNQSLKIRSPDGITKSFNVNGLRRIYGPVIRPEPAMPPLPPPAPESVLPSRSWTRPEPRSEPRRAEKPPEVEKVPPPLEPDFSKPVKNVTELVGRPDFPQCALGEHVEIAGYAGVVVQIINRSLKVRSQEETTRSYNADALRKLYKK